MSYLILIVAFVFPVALLIFAIFAFIAILTGAPFVPSSVERVKRMVELAHIKPAQYVIDLGSGDGRILIAAAQAGARAVGIEINPILVLFTKLKLWWHNLTEQVRVITGDFRKFNIKDADTIFCYHLPGKMAELERKIKAEAKPGAKVVLNAFPFPKLKPIKHSDQLFLYVIR